MRTLRFIPAMLLLLLAQPAVSQPVYRCSDAGKATYSDRPCAHGAATRLYLDPGPPVNVIADARLRLARQLDRRGPADQAPAALCPLSEDARSVPKERFVPARD